MATVRSTWTTTPIPVNGMLPAAEWAGAGVIPIPAGFMMVKNDADNLYVALDLVGDTGNNPGTDDYFWFVVDIDSNNAVTPNRDLLFSAWPGNPNRLGMWRMAAPNATWPAPNTQVIASAVRIGFGPSLNSPAPHRMWEVRFSLAELGITVDPTGPAPVVKFGLRVASATPAFVLEFPASPLSAFGSFHQIILATNAVSNYPPGLAGVVIGGVGLIPATKIGADGYATILAPYIILPDEAAFGGTMNLIGNTATLPGIWAAGAKKYKVMHRAGNTVADVNAAVWTPIRQSWTNYRWTGTTYTWESFGPDGGDLYPLVDPALDYSIKALLFQWDSSTASNNLHQFKIDFFNAANAPVASPPQTLTLRLDNQLPTVKLEDIKHNGDSVAPCAIETMTSATDGVQIVFTASDPEGDLYSYALTAEYGAGSVANMDGDSYIGHRVPTHNWQGVTGRTFPASPVEWVPPVTCAYLFRIAASARVTNGYVFPYGETSDFRTVTLIKPGVRLTIKPIVLTEILPHGFITRDKIAKPGIEPQELGEDTLRKK